jgi:hypothetical protein
MGQEIIEKKGSLEICEGSDFEEWIKNGYPSSSRIIHDSKPGEIPERIWITNPRMPPPPPSTDRILMVIF